MVFLVVVHLNQRGTLKEETPHVCSKTQRKVLLPRVGTTI